MKYELYGLYVYYVSLFCNVRMLGVNVGHDEDISLASPPGMMGMTCNIHVASSDAMDRSLSHVGIKLPS